MAHYEDVMQRILSKGGPASQMYGETGISMPSAANTASVVNPVDSMYQSYNPAGAYAEAGRTVPNYASDWARGMNQVGLPQGGVPSDLHGWNNPYGVNAPLGGDIGNYRTGYPVDAGTPDINQGNDMWWAGSPGYDTEGVSVVPRPTIPTEKQIIDSTVTAPEDERDAAFSRIHNMWARSSPAGDWNQFEPEWAEGLGVPAEYIDFYMQVPLEAKMFAHENKGDAKVQSDFEEKYGFVLDVDVPLQGGMERSDLLNIRSTGIPTAP